MDHENQIISQQLNNLKAPSQNDGFLQKGRRRSKKDKVNRNYICGCGKTYLSYPALYTHIKNKHNSEAPTGTIVHSVNRVKKAATEQSSGVSKSHIGKSEKTGRKGDNQSQMGDEEDFMKDAFKDGHIVNREFATKQPFQYNFSLDDFELVNFLGFQGSCEAEYSFKGKRGLKNGDVMTRNFLETIREYLEFKVRNVERNMDEGDVGNVGGFGSEEISLEKEMKSEISDNDNDYLVLQTKKRSYEMFQRNKVGELSKQKKQNNLKNKKMTNLLKDLKEQKAKVDAKLNKMKDQENPDSQEDDHDEDALSKPSNIEKHPLFFEIKKSTTKNNKN
jgi:hypothetical protein